jgi:endonuclease/exonuclease/phosphatase family metal-dependent hydrolase
MSYNIDRGRHRDALRTVVESVDPDIVIVNEAPRLPLWWRWACPSLARQWQLDHIAGGRNAGGNMICAGEYVGVRSIRLERTRQAKVSDPIRGVAAAQLQVDGHPFGAVACHLGLTPQARARDIEVVLSIAAGLEGPVILAGDLNEDPGSPVWERLVAAGYVDVGGDDELTYPADDPAKRLDALLVLGVGVRIREHQVPAVPPALLSRASDHLPLSATVTW